MKINEQKDADRLICLIEGEINITRSPELRAFFDGIIKKNEKKVLIDFGAVSYIDSSGLATLIEMYQRLKKIGGSMRCCGMNQKIRNTFEITKLHKLFEIFDDRQQALAGF
jgi:anti-sigma B factor antagonist